MRLNESYRIFGITLVLLWQKLVDSALDFMKSVIQVRSVLSVKEGKKLFHHSESLPANW